MDSPLWLRLKNWLGLHANLHILLLEFGLILLLAGFFTAPYLNLDPYTWPQGREFGSQIQAYHFWDDLKACGWCALWNGNINGGAPAMGDVFSAHLHPVVAVLVGVFGTVNGIKLSLGFFIGLAGFAQWWLGYTLGLSPLARTWAALMLMVAGHLAARMTFGAHALIISTSSCILVIAAALHLARNPSYKASVLLAVTGALALLSGQGYMQAGLVFALISVGVYFFAGKEQAKTLLKHFGASVILAVLLAGFFLLPVLRFYPNITKSLTFSFEFTQPLEYFLLNFVIRDRVFLEDPSLGKSGGAWLYSMYVGWIPVILSVLGFALAFKKRRMDILFLSALFVIPVLVGTGFPFKQLIPYFPRIAFVRWPPLLAGFAISGLLGLAAIAVHQLWAYPLSKLALDLSLNNRKVSIAFDLKLLLLIPLVFSIRSAYQYSSQYIGVTQGSAPVFEAVGVLDTESTQWVSTPFGEHFWIEPALDNRLKLANVVWAWNWANRPMPQPKLLSSREELVGAGEIFARLGEGENPPYVYLQENVEYASLGTQAGTFPCRAQAQAGEIEVQCSDNLPGVLTVTENMYPGWRAWVNGQAVSLVEDAPWLTVPVPAGEKTIVFRYQPWDVPLGLFFSFVGLVLAVWLWRKQSPPQISAEEVLPDEQHTAE